MIPRTLLALALLLPASSLLAEEAPAEAKPPVEALDIAFDLDFEGGRLDSLLAAMERAIGARPNVIIDNKSRSATVPEFRLRDVDTVAVLKALEPFLHPQGVDVDIERQGTDIVVISQRPRRSMTGMVIERVVRPFDLSTYLGHYSIDDIVTTIETSWELQGEKDKATLRYHEETRILLAAGSHDQLAAVAEILKVLDHQIQVQNQPTAPTVTEPKPHLPEDK